MGREEPTLTTPGTGPHDDTAHPTQSPDTRHSQGQQLGPGPVT